MGHYLHRLPVRVADRAGKTTSSGRPPISPSALLGALALFAVSSVAALALERIGATLPGSVPPGWPANGCLGASVAPLGAHVVVGQASLCVTDGGLRGALDLEHLEPSASYVEWVAYFESPSLCSFGPVLYQVYGFNQPCTLADLDGPQHQGIAQSLAEAAADAQGVLHIDGSTRDIDLGRHSQAWLLVSRPSSSYVRDLKYRPVQNDASEPVARAVFDVP